MAISTRSLRRRFESAPIWFTMFTGMAVPQGAKISRCGMCRTTNL
ncbi:MAG: hypothetical protein F2894_04840 [Actinobacteria bacterium]|nr:hypothetical protein [Actinomycetota bacterium]MSW05518.1 hypothetical protein [Actinomycetota bacterium]MSX32996.1 hypothetical protein [Actinomycetota bacterium]MSX81480.1 hypothetical protein [Actinomycetota bacterium]MSY06205.1 hypothetical protein [Actinomycetota bacterium]